MINGGGGIHKWMETLLTNGRETPLTNGGETPLTNGRETPLTNGGPSWWKRVHKEEQNS